MKVNNKSFNEWLEKEKKIKHQEETKHSKGEYYKWGTDDDGIYRSVSITEDWLIGLMVQYLLDNVRGINIGKNEEDYYIDTPTTLRVSTDFVNLLRNEIESIKE